MEETLAVASVTSSAIGAMIGSCLCDVFGRRRTLSVCSSLSVMGSLLMAISPTPSIAIIGQMAIGLSIGIAALTVPLYVSEVSPYEVRGRMIVLTEFSIMLGQHGANVIHFIFNKVIKKNFITFYELFNIFNICLIVNILHADFV